MYFFSSFPSFVSLFCVNRWTCSSTTFCARFHSIVGASVSIVSKKAGRNKFYQNDVYWTVSLNREFSFGSSGGLLHRLHRIDWYLKLVSTRIWTMNKSVDWCLSNQRSEAIQFYQFKAKFIQHFIRNGLGLFDFFFLFSFFIIY